MLQKLRLAFGSSEQIPLWKISALEPSRMQNWATPSSSSCLRGRTPSRMVAQAGWRLRRFSPVHPLCSVEKLLFSWSNISCCHLILSPVHPQWAHINISLKTGRGREATSEALKFIFWHFNSLSGCFVFWPGVFFPMEMRGVSGWKRERLFFQQGLLKQISV